MHSVLCIEKCYSIVRPIAHRTFALKPSSTRQIIGGLAVCFLGQVAIFSSLGLSSAVEAKFSQSTTFRTFLVDMTSLAINGFVLYIPLVIEIVTHALMIRQIKMSISTRQRKKLLRAMKTVVFTVSVYYVCNIPGVLTIAWILVGNPPPSVAFASMQFLMTNSFVNIFIYSFSNPRFRGALKRTFGFVPQVVPEIHNG